MTNTINAFSLLLLVQWGNKALGLLSTFILARLLTPDDFGVVAISASTLALIEGFFAFNVTSVLISNKDNTEEDYRTAWTLSMLRSAVIFTIIVLFSFFADSYYQKKGLALVFMVIAFQTLIKGAVSPKFINYEKNVDFTKFAITLAISRIIGVILTIYIAFEYKTYWSIIIGGIFTELIVVIIGYCYAPWTPRFSLSKFKHFFQFSGWLSLNSIFASFNVQLDNIMIGRFVDVANAGSYYLSKQISSLPTQELSTPLNRVLFPVFSKRSLTEIKANIERLIPITTSLLFPAGILFCLLAEEMVNIVLGDNWVHIVPYIQILAPVLSIQMLTSVISPALMSLGKTKTVFCISAIYFTFRVPLFLFGLFYYDVIGAVVAVAFCGILFSSIQMTVIKLTFSVSIITILKRSLASITSLAITILVIIILFDNLNSLSSLTSAFIKLSVFIILYFSILFSLWAVLGKPKEGAEELIIEKFKALMKP